MFFKNQKKENTPAATPARVSSFLTKESKFEGTITTNDNVHFSTLGSGNKPQKKP